MKQIANAACTTGLTSSYLECQDYQGLSCAALNQNGGPNCELDFLLTRILKINLYFSMIFT